MLVVFLAGKGGKPSNEDHLFYLVFAGKTWETIQIIDNDVEPVLVHQ